MNGLRRLRVWYEQLWSPPLAGLSLREQRRFTKMARAGHRVASPIDADRVRELIASRYRVRLPVLSGYVCIGSSLIGQAWLDLASGGGFRSAAVWAAVYVTLPIAMWPIVKKIERQTRRTLQANGWEEPSKVAALAASGMAIGNAHDAHRALEYINWIDRLRRPALALLAIEVMLSGSAVALYAFTGRSYLTIYHSLDLASFIGLWVFWHRRRQLHSRTIAANGWTARVG